MDHAAYMRAALAEARRSPPKPTNYCVGAVLVDLDTDKVLATGYTLELPGNTHAEQCCLQKVAAQHGIAEGDVHTVLPRCTLYTTMEPCIERLSGNAACVDRIIAAKRIERVLCGVREPDTFVGQNAGRAKLAAAGISCEQVAGFEEDILAVATAGHVKEA